MNLKSMLIYEEGRRNKPYKDSLGFWTGGIGHKMTETELKDCSGFIPDSLIDRWYDSDTAKAANSAKKYSWFKDLNEPRQAVIISMIFQMGEAGFAEFKKMIQCLVEGRILRTSQEMLLSKWAKQTSARAKRHSEQMRTGEWCKEYLTVRVNVLILFISSHPQLRQ